MKIVMPGAKRVIKKLPYSLSAKKLLSSISLSSTKARSSSSSNKGCNFKSLSSGTTAANNAATGGLLQFSLSNNNRYLCNANASSTKKRKMMSTNAAGTKSHYEAHSSDTYESAYFYSQGEYNDYLSTLIAQHLSTSLRGNNNSSSNGSSNIGKVEASSEADAEYNKEERRRILDIGGGTGSATKDIMTKLVSSSLFKEDEEQKVISMLDAIVIDPFLEETKKDVSEVEKMIKFVKATGESFIDPITKNEWYRKENYHQVLMKEVVHHLSDRTFIYKAMIEDMKRNHNNNNIKNHEYPNILIITRPQTDIDYPLWDDAKKVWAKNQPSANSIINELIEAGIQNQNIKTTIESYPCKINTHRWISMIKNRFWSTFSNFTDDELHTGCNQILEEYYHNQKKMNTLSEDENENTIDNDIIHFEDRLVFISVYI